MTATLGLALLLLSGGGETPFHWAGAEEAATRGLQARDPATRLAALELLIEVRSERADGILRATLRDPDRTLRLLAARLLVARRDAAAVSTLTEWLGGGNAADRAAALEALRLVGPPGPELRAALERTLRDPDSQVKLAALSVLESDPRPSALRLALLLEDPRPSVRLTAARLLGRAADPRTAVALSERLADVDPEVQREAVRALGRLGDRRTGPALLRLFHHGPPELREAVVDALAALRLPAAVPALSRLAQQRPADARARQAQRALGEIGTPEAVEALLAELDRGPPSAELEEALARHPAASAPQILAMLHPEDARAPLAARLAGALRLRQAIPALLTLLRLRGAAALPALRSLTPLEDDPRILPAVIDAAENGPPSLRRAALDALVTAPDPRSAGILAAAIADEDPHLRLRGLELAARLGPTAAAPAGPPALRAISDPVPAVAVAAVEAVRVLRPAGAVGPLLAALSRSPGRALSVGRALRAAARAPDRPALLRALRAGEGDVRLAVLDGLVAALAGGRTRGESSADSGAVARELQRSLSRGGPEAELAAEALATDAAAIDPAFLVRAFEEAAPAAKALLVEPVARLRDGPARLCSRLEDADEQPEVRAAAAWALAGRRGAHCHRRLAWVAETELHPAVAANARSALSTKDGPVSARTVRLAAPAGVSTARHWVKARAVGGPEIWARTGSLGQARLTLPAGARSVELQLPGSELALSEVALEHAGHGVGQLAGQDVPGAEAARRLLAGQAVDVDSQHRRVLRR